jgi:tetratricopeptide (TPR) repeat protein
VIRFFLARALETTAGCLRDLGHPGKAAAAAGKAARAYRDVRMGDERSAAGLAAVLATQAACLQELGRAEQALAANADAVEVCRALARWPARPGLTSSLGRLAGRLRALGQTPEELAGRGKRELTVLGELFTALTLREAWPSGLGRDTDAAVAAAEAQAVTGHAVKAARRLAAVAPQFRGSLAEALAGHAEWLWAAGQRDGAMAAVTEAVGLGRPLAAGDREARAAFAGTLDTLAGWLHDLGRAGEALAAAGEAATAYWQLDTGEPGGFRGGLAAALARQAAWLRELGRPTEARAAAREARAVAAMTAGDSAQPRADQRGT